MSVLSPQVGIVARVAPSAKAPPDDLYVKWMVAAAMFFVTLEVCYLAYAGLPPLAKPWIDGTHFVLGRDFLNTWMGGRSVFAGGPQPWFDLRTYNIAIQQILGAPYQLHYWSYPPHVLLFIWPFGLLPYLPAYIAWCAIGIALYVFACSGAIPRERLLFLAVAPGIGICIFFGQNGFYTAALLIGGWLSLDRRPVLAGILFGILTVKPQIGFLLPVVLLFERRWVTIASAVVTTAALVTATAMLFGWSIWIEFWQKVMPQQQWLTANGGGLLYVMVSSVYYGIRLMHLPDSLAWVLQWITSAIAFAAFLWTFWKRRDRTLQFAMLVTATFLVTPYILNYDMVVFGFVVALLLQRDDSTAADRWLLLAVWTLPAVMMLAGLFWIPYAPVVLIAFAGRLIWRLAHGDRRDGEPLPAAAAPAAA
jgi:alpha-1,2-mannosyltransferase